MCGIIGYTGNKKKAKEYIISGLKNLEYRGYDSAGIALTEGNKINLYKSRGKISNLEDSIKQKEFNSSTGIGHTRWATHGEPNETNAHPHKCGKVTIVHNGIIENYIELRKKLESKGVKFNSETDTEVACAYINYVYENEKKNSNGDAKKLNTIIKACSDFRGSYAFGILFEDEPNILYTTRKDSPLIIGVGENENFIASDVSAILDFTKEYILLETGEFARISSDSIRVYNSNLEVIPKKINTATWSASEYKKNGYDHFMLKEINEQPKVINNIFKKYLNANSLSKIDFEKFSQIHIVACGSAMHAGLIGKYLLENYANIPVTVEVASEYRYKNQLITENTLVIIISQSGETADTLAALRIAKEKGAKTLAIVNAVGSSISREADETIYTYAGPEIAVATTKGYTTQVAVLSVLCLNIMKDKNLLTDEINEKIQYEFKNIEKVLIDIVKKTDDYKKVAKKIYEKNNLFYIGRGIDYALCMEGSLKLKEISYMHSEAYAAGELKHGTISLIEDGTPVIAIATNKELYEKTVSNIKETKARGAFSILISPYVNNTSDFADIAIEVPDLSEFTNALTTVCVLQLIAYETARLRGCNIDKPKNLAKSVTVE